VLLIIPLSRSGRFLSEVELGEVQVWNYREGGRWEVPRSSQCDTTTDKVLGNNIRVRACVSVSATGCPSMALATPFLLLVLAPSYTPYSVGVVEWQGVECKWPTRVPYHFLCNHYADDFAATRPGSGVVPPLGHGDRMPQHQGRLVSLRSHRESRSLDNVCQECSYGP
jgi:hypothetical protein